MVAYHAAGNSVQVAAADAVSHTIFAHSQIAFDSDVNLVAALDESGLADIAVFFVAAAAVAAAALVLADFLQIHACVLDGNLKTRQETQTVKEVVFLVAAAAVVAVRDVSVVFTVVVAAVVVAAVLVVAAVAAVAVLVVDCSVDLNGGKCCCTASKKLCPVLPNGRSC